MTNSITLLCLILDKYKNLEKNSLSYTSHVLAKDIVQDLEKLKETLKNDRK